MYYSHSGEEARRGNGLVARFRKAQERSVYMTEHVSYHPVEGPLKSLRPVVLEMVSGGSLESLWDYLVCEYHYLGYQKLLGRRLKYLAFIGGRPVAALSWSAAARKLAARDRFIGWSEEQRKMYLSRIAANSRFLIMPWVRVPNLASYVLALNIRRLIRDWRERYRYSLWLVETFVDPLRFRGTCYRAANWMGVGQSYGSGKQGQGYVYHGEKKEVYLYVLEPRFRELIGCQQKRHSPEGDSPRSITIRKMGELHMILKDTRWHPEMVPVMELTEEDVLSMADELVLFHRQFQDCFGRVEHRRLGQAYLSGLLSSLDAKSVEPIALNFLGKSSVRSLQQFMKDYQWDHNAMLRGHQRMLSEMIASADGMLTVDSSEFIKKGKESVGVARQYCGAAGKVENCQSGVFVGYASEKGYGLLHARLYLPQVWFSEEYEKRRRDTGIPQDIPFQTKPQIALDLLREVSGTGLFPARWVGCDATFTSDPEFLASLPDGVFYFGSIRSNTRVYLEKPRLGLPPYQGRGRRPKRHRLLSGEAAAQTVAQLAQSKRCSWTPTILAEGAKGPIVAEVTRIRVYPARGEAAQEHPVWLFMRRTDDGQNAYSADLDH